MSHRYQPDFSSLHCRNEIRRNLIHYMTIGLQHQPFDLFFQAYNSIPHRPVYGRRTLDRLFVWHMNYYWELHNSDPIPYLYNAGWRAIIRHDNEIDFVRINVDRLFEFIETDRPEEVDPHFPPPCPPCA